MKDFEKIVRVGKTPEGHAFAKIKYSNGKLSISGAIGPKRNGDCTGSCGQWIMSAKPDEIEPGKGWDAETVREFLQVWDKWHLNDMQAGSPDQTAELEKHKFPGYPVNHFEWAQGVLRDAGLQPDKGYLHEGKPYYYGTAWLTVSVPDDALEFLRALPDTDITPAWV